MPSIKSNEIDTLLNTSIFKAEQLELNLRERNTFCTQENEVTKTLSTIIEKTRELRKELSITSSRD